MIDFAIFLSPADAEMALPASPPFSQPTAATQQQQQQQARTRAALKAIQALRRKLPSQAINHTDFLPLRNRVLAVSVETKPPPGTDSGKSREAELQIGVWHCAQWRLLEQLVGIAHAQIRTPRATIVRDGEATAATTSLHAVPQQPPSLPPFLPAIIVRGHEWSFVATTRQPVDGQTVLWLEAPFGSTGSPLGIYKAVWGIRRLARWADEAYWPWFRAAVLRLGDEMEELSDNKKPISKESSIAGRAHNKVV